MTWLDHGPEFLDLQMNVVSAHVKDQRATKIRNLTWQVMLFRSSAGAFRDRSYLKSRAKL
ncbi:MAG: hypothetical protein DMF72_08120 [Acidobacteria bacterium]|nr:MAG: hypothetical protein DMF72_08120 [Acidobacteriota bacterium]